ncbi:MAG: hypothetical protein H6923_04045 [Alphaproteobacteria bacterium]|nr:hypothetical protein [Alphaproteobacteria bacterium]
MAEDGASRRAEREARLARALRENLRRRKAGKASERREAGTEEEAGEGVAPPARRPRQN